MDRPPKWKAPYVAEMARADLFNRLGEDTYTAGFRVFTTIDSRLQQAANSALRLGLIEYDRRHGYRGPIARVPIVPGKPPAELLTTLEEHAAINVLQPALVVDRCTSARRVSCSRMDARHRSIGRNRLGTRRGRQWRRPGAEACERCTPRSATSCMSSAPATPPSSPSCPRHRARWWRRIRGDGAIVALDGGFDFFVSKFNRVMQARRQPGSAFKPFIYSAALENGFTPSSIVIMDAPVVLEDTAAEDTWRPENQHGRVLRAYPPARGTGPLTKSRLRVVDARNGYCLHDGLPAALRLSARGPARRFDPGPGSLQLTPAELAAGFATFANGGFHVQPYYLERIEDAYGKALFDAARGDGLQ